MLSKFMKELDHERVMYRGKKFFSKNHVIELKESGLLEVKHKSKLDPDSMISTTELCEIYDIPAWIRHKIMEASGLKPIMRSSGRVYFYKNDIIPYFESYKAGTLKFKPRIRKK